MRYKLVAFDMDDTLLSGRTIYVLADRKNFRKEIDKIISLKIPNYIKTIEIAKFLRGMSVDEFLQIFRSIPLNKNVPEVIKELKEMGMKLAIISNSYDLGANDLARRLDFDFVIANKLVVENGVITGEVIPYTTENVDDISDCRSCSVCKRDALLEICRKMNIDPSESIAVGDGGIDRFMLEIAGLGVAYRPKVNLIKYADAIIEDMAELLDLIR